MEKEVNFRVAVKSFIVNDGKVLLLRGRVNYVHKPGVWDIPGGRLALGEDPFLGLKRETKEETSLPISIQAPLHVQHFTRDDGQKITMLIFLCSPLEESIILSEEHQEYQWADLLDKQQFPNWLHPVVDSYQNLHLK